MTLLVRCSAIGRLMTEPRSKAEGQLSQGAKTAIRDIAAQDILGIEFEFTSKEMEKGIECEPEAIALLNRVRGLTLTKNTERRSNDWLTGECDLFDATRRCGHDTKVAWSASTFPIIADDIGGSQRALYEWQMRGYLSLWDADEWEVNYVLLSTPERLIGYESQAVHFVDHIPEHMRLTTWTIKRDAKLEEAMFEKVRAAREYYAQVIEEFERQHRTTNIALAKRPSAPVAADMAALRKCLGA